MENDKPQGYYDEIEITASKKDNLLQFLKGYEVSVYSNSDEDYDYLEDNDLMLVVKNPYCDETLDIELAGEFSLFFAGWHMHYFTYEYDYEEMKKDIILCGVGGQGILSVATIIGEAATKAGVNLKQAEVHGMSQRGGDVQSNLRLSTEPIYSDLIPKGGCDLIISMEPMEALRYLPYLAENGVIVTSNKPFVNIPDYPAEEVLFGELNQLPHVVQLDIEEVAKEAGSVRSANVVLLGMAAKYLEIVTPGQLRDAVRTIFARKGEAVVEANLKAFDAANK